MTGDYPKAFRVMSVLIRAGPRGIRARTISERTGVKIRTIYRILKAIEVEAQETHAWAFEREDGKARLLILGNWVPGSRA